MSSGLRLYLAPFQGITGHVYREQYTLHFDGIDKLYSPFFTSIHKQKSLEQKANKITQTSHHGIELVPQILSKDANEIIRFANYCKERGFKEINWNLGCPYPRVANKKRGSGMLPFPEMVNEILEMVMAEVKIPFSIKCRLGYLSPLEIFKMIPIFNRFNISELTIHARIGKQLYAGEVDLNSFKKAIAICEIPVVYNGDIFSVKKFNSISSCFPDLSSFMIGRGLLMDPFLPSDIKGLTCQDVDRKSVIQKFVKNLYYAYRKDKNDNLHVIGTMKELWSHLSFSFNNQGKVFGLIKKTKSFDAYEIAVNQVFEDFHWVGYKE